MRSAFRFLSAEVRGLHRAASILAGAALLSSLLALARDRLLAHTFGAGAELDLYYAAFRIPDLIFVATGAMVSVYILIPELSRRNENEQKKYLDTIVAAFSIFAVIVSGITAFFAPLLLAHLFPQFVSMGELDELSLLTRIILLQPIFLGLSNIIAAITQARNRYTLYALSPLLYNLGIIFGVGVLYPSIGIAGLAWGVVLGALFHVGIQIPAVRHDGFLRGMPKIHNLQTVFDTAFVSLPRALALSMNQIAFLGLTALASFLSAGSIAIFMFAYNLQAVPLAIIGASYSVAAFPTLAAALSKGETESFLNHIATAARYVFFWSLPATALIVVLRAHLVRVILGSGNFDWTDTRLTAAVFAVLSLSLVAQGLTLLLIRGYYAAGRTFTPFLVAGGTMIATLVLGVYFINLFEKESVQALAQSIMRLQGVSGTPILALGLAYAISTIGGTIALAIFFERKFRGFFSRVSRSFFESIIAAVVALVATYAILNVVGPLEVGSTTLTVFLKGLVGGVSGLIVSGLTYWALGSIEFADTVLSIRGRLFKDALGVPGAALATPAEETPGQA